MARSTLCLLVVIFFFLLVLANSVSSLQPSCHDEESSALFQFKQSFIAPYYQSKILSWKLENNSSCCSWDGVECDQKTGYVLGLDLSSSWLHGSMSSSSTLFHLAHLERLNLADNDFSYSQIPSDIRNFPELTYLNLSGSSFSGQIPSEVWQLSKLLILDLSKNPFTGPISASLANLTQLTTLSVCENQFTGPIPSEVWQLSKLLILDLSKNHFTGPISASLANLTQLTTLSVCENHFTGPIPSEVWQLSKLLILDLSKNYFTGPISASLANLTQLTTLSVCENQFTGPIPSSLGNLSTLTKIDLSRNELHGLIPESFSRLTNLLTLYLNSNSFNGTIDFNMFHKLQNLSFLDLSSNKLELLDDTRTVNSTLSKLQFLGLGSCNMREFPSFLQYQKTLLYLDLSANKMQGQVPKWMWNMSTESLLFVNISHNLLSGFDQPPALLPWRYLRVLDFSSNMLHGQLPIPGPNVSYYQISNNKLTGEVSPVFCNLTYLQYLDLSNNRLSGILPQRLGYLSKKLQILKLGNNSFHGLLPQTCSKMESSLRMLDVSNNKLHGQVPRSLADCGMLEFIVLSTNDFNDTFPVWLGTLTGLKLLAMRNSGFHGVIENQENSYGFPNLLVLDLSQNSFAGKFPPDYLFLGDSISGFAPAKSPESTYMGAPSEGVKRNYPQIQEDLFAIYYECYGTTITSKGVERYYPQIQENFGMIDISGNRFEGNIPDFIGNLTGLRFLNVSNNIFTDHIPAALGNLIQLESLDLSENKLSGEIPQQLTQLTFLAVFNVSHNNLTGTPPKGKQFSTFDSTSYEGNIGLCGDPLPKKCGQSGHSNAPPIPPPAKEESGSSSVFEFDRKFVLAGFGSGLVVGIVAADVLISWRHKLFTTVVGILIRVMRRRSQ